MLLSQLVTVPHFKRKLVSLAAVFWMSRKAPLGEHCVTSKKRLHGRLGGSRLLNPAKYISFTTMHHWASSTRLLTAKKEPGAILLNICFIILYQFIPLMIYRYSSIQCTDFYQLPTASNLQDKKIFLNRPSLISNTPSPFQALR